jgi:hypothetical protein
LSFNAFRTALSKPFNSWWFDMFSLRVAIQTSGR